MGHNRLENRLQFSSIFTWRNDQNYHLTHLVKKIDPDEIVFFLLWPRFANLLSFYLSFSFPFRRHYSLSLFSSNSILDDSKNNCATFIFIYSMSVLSVDINAVIITDTTACLEIWIVCTPVCLTAHNSVKDQVRKF